MKFSQIVLSILSLEMPVISFSSASTGSFLRNSSVKKTSSEDVLATNVNELNGATSIASPDEAKVVDMRKLESFLVDPIRQDEQWLYVYSTAQKNFRGHEQHFTPKCGGHLASFSNQQEFDYVYDLAQQRRNLVWVGATKETDGQGNPFYTWSDGTSGFYDEGNFTTTVDSHEYAYARYRASDMKYINTRSWRETKGDAVLILPLNFANQTLYPDCNHEYLIDGRPLNLWNEYKLGGTPGPTPGPTPSPTPGPTVAPTPLPTYEPTFEPTHVPTAIPTQAPTPAPTDSSNCGMEVTQDLVLVEDMNCTCKDSPALTITNNGVNVDLNGYTIRCGDSYDDAQENSLYECVAMGLDVINDASIFGGTVENCRQYGIYVRGNRNTIHNVKVANSDRGLYIEFDSSNNLIHNVTLENNQWNFEVYHSIGDSGSGNMLYDSNLTSSVSSQQQIRIYAPSTFIVGNNINGYQKECILLEGFANSNTISDNSIKNCGQHGIHVKCNQKFYSGTQICNVDSNLITGNDIQDVGMHGILVSGNSDGNQIEQNSIGGTVNQNCIRLNSGSDSNVLNDNYCENAVWTGIYMGVSSNNTLKSNTVTKSGDQGFYAETQSTMWGGHHFISNIAEDNANDGFQLLGVNSVGSEYQTLFEFNIAQKNGQHGFHFSQDVGNLTIIDNTSNENGEDGFHIQGSTTANTNIVFSGINIAEINLGNGFMWLDSDATGGFSNDTGSLAVAQENGGYGFLKNFSTCVDDDDDDGNFDFQIGATEAINNTLGNELPNYYQYELCV